MNAEFQRIARRDEKAFLSDQCKEIEESNRMRKTRDLVKKIRHTDTNNIALGISITICARMLSCYSRVRLFATPWTVACQDPLSIGFSRQEYWSGLPFPPPQDLPNPRIELVCPEAPALQVDSLTIQGNFIDD